MKKYETVKEEIKQIFMQNNWNTNRLHHAMYLAFLTFIKKTFYEEKQDGKKKKRRSKVVRSRTRNK